MRRVIPVTLTVEEVKKLIDQPNNKYVYYNTN